MKAATLSISIVLLVATVAAYRAYRERSESNRQSGNESNSALEFQKANQKLDKVLELPRGM